MKMILSGNGTRVFPASGAVVIGVVLMLTLSGCGLARVVLFVKHEKSGRQTPQETALYLVAPGQKKAPDELKNNELIKELEKADCIRRQQNEQQNGYQKLTPYAALFTPYAALAVIGSGDRLVRYAASFLDSRVDKFKEESSKDYKASLILDEASSFGADGDGDPCLVLVRRDVEDKKRMNDAGEVSETGLVLILKIHVTGDRKGFQLEPVYLMVNNAVAKTGESKPIDVSAGFSGKVILTVDGKNELYPFGQASFSFPEIGIGEPVKRDKLPRKTGLTPMPPQNAGPLEITIAVVESGSGLPHADKAKAEIKAVSEAIGSILK